jgi:succinate-semialdehyde dehydrogenase/glutarate-semialdehyde dehydrogenase
VEQAAEIAAKFKFRNMGQVCISASRFFAQESIADEFTRSFIEVTRNLRVGNGLDEGVDVGPLGNRRRIEATEALIQDALDKGATLEIGGKRHEEFEKGFFFEPTVISGVTPDMRIMNEEPFCPVAPICSFTDIDDAIQKANATEYGLAAYIFTTNLKTAFLASERIEAGMVGVNAVYLATAEGPFGGIKHSGFGREGGAEGIRDYTVEKFIKMKL